MINSITKQSKSIVAAALMLCSVSMAANAQGNTEEYLRITGPAAVGGYYQWRTSNVWMYRETPSLFSAAVYLEGDKEFKFLTGTGWDWGCVQYSAAVDPFVFTAENQTATLVRRESTDGNDFKFKVAQSGNYLLTANLETMELTAKPLAYQEKLDWFPALYVAGAKGNWNLSQAVPLVVTDENNPQILTGEVELNAGNDFKLASAIVDGFWDQWFGVKSAEDGKYDMKENPQGADDNKWVAENTATYSITVDRVARTIEIKDLTNVGVGSVAAAKTTIFAANGNVVICADSNCRAEIFDAAGRLVKTAPAAAGERTTVAMSAGLYVVRAAGIARLVNIR